MNKTELRQTLRTRLASISPDDAALFDTQISSLFFGSQSFMPQSIIANYIPLKGEVSCRGIVQKLATNGQITCLPAVIARENPMVFRQYKPGDILRRGIMGPLEPSPTAREVLPDVLLIPMIGFSRKGYRLGYGTGFYDRTLEVLRKIKTVKAIGLAYSVQEIDDFPIEVHDKTLDLIITEKEVIEIK